MARKMLCPVCSAPVSVERTDAYPDGTYRKVYCTRCQREYPTWQALTPPPYPAVMATKGKTT